jgi:hypothetical protein
LTAIKRWDEVNTYKKPANNALHPTCYAALRKRLMRHPLGGQLYLWPSESERTNSYEDPKSFIKA